ncbi:hypothetical protein MNBD_BACTEROID03-629 [hydrothermal vent metagenome]|uniref:DUF6242 domain-containing protein n=1 Tax=hydrothermal vent metagenome TaxID=652676 RepID=A0A3B0TCR1_9ZZZZ
MKTTKKAMLLAMSVLVLQCSKDDGPTPPAPEPENQAPGAFALLQVADNGTDVDLQPTFSWNTSTDPDGDVVKYDVYLGQEADPATKIASGLGTASFALNDRLSLIEQYYWKVVAKDGKGKEAQSGTFGFTTRNLKIPSAPVMANAAFSPRQSPTVVVGDNKLWLVGGFDGTNFKNDVWSSSDGVNWTEVTAAAAFPERNRHSSVVFNDRLWVFGGVSGGPTGIKNDVWSSDDGADWKQVNQNTPFKARDRHTTVVFKDLIWLIGGLDKSFSHLNDILSTEDGLLWAGSTAPFSARSSHACVVFNDKIWVIGGKDDTGRRNDVWNSSDGVNWIEVTPAAAFSPRSEHKVEVYDNKMWLIGGYDGDHKNDVWYSEDGINWVKPSIANNIPARAFFETTVFNDKIWLIGGISGSTRLNDVWAFD